MNNLTYEQLNSRLEEINKQIEEIESLSNNINVDTVTITTSGSIDKRISKEKVYEYMNLIEEKQRISNQIKMLAITNNDNIKQSLPKEKAHSEYQIINKETHFKDGSFQKIKEKNNILTTTKDRVKFMEEPFNMMKDQNSNIGSRDDLSKYAASSRENRRKIGTAKKRILTLPDSKGYISNAAFIIITSIFITVLIFLTVGLIVF